MRDRVAALTAKWREDGYDLGFGIGIAHGETTLGQIGFEGRFDYSAIGRVPNIAAQLCAEARHGQILIDPAVQSSIGGLVKCEEVGSITLKGIKNPVKALNVLVLLMMFGASANRHSQSYSIISSARPSKGSGIVNPSVFAVFRLMMSSTFEDC